MEECELPPVGRNHPWKTATMRRMAWAQSRESWPTPESEEARNNNNNNKKQPETTSETGRIPNNIASWLSECRTPLGASLDEQSSSPTKGPPRNGCSFEDDLSLGAEAHLLQSSSAKPDPSNYDVQAVEKRNQFRQKARSMNSTGSGKSSGTVSSVSELLDLYEEDPEEILYNLGFGREEPDIASKIPSRFFNTSSNAKGIDIKVYLGAQMQRMELENPNYALTSRFRQTEVLATVANVFSEIYSQVSGRPLQKICQKAEAEPKDPAPLRRNSSTLNAVKILKKSITRPNLVASSETAPTQVDPEGTKNSVCEPHSDAELKQKIFRRKDSSLATVAEESNQSGVDVSDKKAESSKLVNGERLSAGVLEKSEVIPDVSETPVSVNSRGEIAESESSAVSEKQKALSSSLALDKEPFSFLPNPHIAHLLTQPRDSFEMEELQSNDDELVSVTRCYSREGSEPFLRTASQQSDSSGFAEDPSTEGSANFLKVQESSDSCDSETTVTACTDGPGTPGTLEHPAFERLLVDEELLVQDRIGLFSPIGPGEVPGRASQQVPSHCIMEKTRPETLETALSETETRNELADRVSETNSSSESVCTPKSANPELSTGPACTEVISAKISNASGKITSLQKHTLMEINSSPSSFSNTSEPVIDDIPAPGESRESEISENEDLGNSGRKRGALLQAQQRTTSCEEQRGRVWIRSGDLLRNLNEQVRNPLQRSSSLPTSLLSPTRVVSSVHIQLGQGSVRQCTPPCYSYLYEEEPKQVTSIAEEEDQEYGFRDQSDVVDNSISLNPDTELDSTVVPPYPMNVPQHLSRSSSSLYSIPADWPLRRVAEAPVWSTHSVPDLTQHTRIPHPAIPRHIQQELPQFRGPFGSPYQKLIPVNPPSRSCTPINSPCPCAHGGMYSHHPQPQNSPFPHPVYAPPHGSPFPQQNMAYTHPQSTSSLPFQSPSVTNPYGSSCNLHLQSIPYNPHVPLTHTCSAPCSLAYGNAPYNSNMPCGHQCNSPFQTPPAMFSPMSNAPFTSDTPTPSSMMGSTEMQLRRVLHEIRGTVQSFDQNASEQHDGTPSGVHSPNQAVQPLYEELQRRRRNLKVFRTQMMDLELSLMRQQSMVYQHLTADERQEAEQLQRLRVAVRQELQELELQLEDRLLTPDDPFHSARSSRLYRHPLDISRGRSMDSLSSSSALRATEPVSELLREQMYLQSELNYTGAGAADTPTSARSSRTASPVRSHDLAVSPSRGREAVYRSTVSLTPSIPSRSRAESREQTTTTQNMSPSPEVTAWGQSHSVSEHGGDDNEPTIQEDGRGGEGGGGGGGGEGREAPRNTDMQQLIQQIKQSLTEEIRKEIVSELLTAVLSQKAPVGTREPAP